MHLNRCIAFLSCLQGVVLAHIVERHPGCAEALLKDLAAEGAAQGRQIVNGIHSLIDIIDDKSSDAVIDDLGNRAAAEPDDGGSQAMASIMTKPKGSGQSIGKSRAAARSKIYCFSLSPTSFRNSMEGSFSKGLMEVSKYSRSTLSTLAAMHKGKPARRAISMALSTPFSGEMRPTKARHEPGEAAARYRLGGRP